MNPTRVWRDKAGNWHMTCEAPCCTHTTCSDQAMAFEAALGHVAYWHHSAVISGPVRDSVGSVDADMIPATTGRNGTIQCEHEWSARGGRFDGYWRECWLCGKQEDVSPGEWLGHRDEARAQGGTW